MTLLSNNARQLTQRSIQTWLFKGFLMIPTNKSGFHNGFLLQELSKASFQTKIASNCQFHTHFHPYTTELIKELIEGSVAGLQAADTEYKKREDGSLETFADDHPIERLRRKPVPKLYEKAEGFF